MDGVTQPISVWTLLARVRMLFMAAFCVLLIGCKMEKPDNRFDFSGTTMGTSYSVSLASQQPDLDVSGLQQQVEQLLSSINKKMSTYNPESELSLFNQQNSTEWVEMSPETIDLIQTARRVSRDTGGAYDITLGSVIDLWGFGPEPATSADKPSMDKILDTMNNVGHQLLQISKDGTQLRKLVPDITVDLSSIAKGYAVDAVGKLLEGQTHNRYVVEIGGEIRSRGQSPDKKPWQIGIESPDPETQVAGYVALAVESAHIATSGDYRNYREVGGERLSHIIDGRSGYPVNHNLASVTVMHGTTAQADAWATAFMVMGADEAIAVANKKGLAIAITVREGERFVNYSTAAFEAYKVK